MKKFLDVSYNITYSNDATKFLQGIPLKHAKTVEGKIKECLVENPKGRTHHCNIKPIEGTNPKKYRFHISMKYTLIYTIDEKNKSVFVSHAMGINQAHSKYGIV